MNAVHVARAAAPVSKKPTLDNIDSLYQRQRHIKSLSILIDYCIEKNAEEGDGPTVPHVSTCLDLIMKLADESRTALDELRDDFHLVRK